MRSQERGYSSDQFTQVLASVSFIGCQLDGYSFTDVAFDGILDLEFSQKIGLTVDGDNIVVERLGDFFWPQ